VADYVECLKFRREKPHPADEVRLAALYAEFEAEDPQLAELRMGDYAERLARRALRRALRFPLRSSSREPSAP